MTEQIRIHSPEGIPNTGSYEVHCLPIAPPARNDPAVPGLPSCAARGEARGRGMLCSILVVLVAVASFSAGVAALWLLYNWAAKQRTEQDKLDGMR